MFEIVYVEKQMREWKCSREKFYPNNELFEFKYKTLYSVWEISNHI